MSEQSAKKSRSAKQVTANEASRERAKKLAEESAEFFKKTGLSARVPFPGMYAKLKREGKTDDEIVALLQQKQTNIAATRKVKSASKAAPAAPAPAPAPLVVAAANNNNTANANTVASPRSVASKPKSAAKEAANTAQSNTARKFTNRGLKAYPQAVSYYIGQRKTGKNDEAIFAEIKGRPNLQKAPTRTKRNTNVAAPSVAAPSRAAAANATNAVQPLGMKKGAVKGHWICDNCRFVPTTNTRKNNTKPTMKNNAGEDFYYA